MKEQKDEKWLDELISGAIDSSKPQFDAEQWKEKYPEEFKMLASRARQGSRSSTSQPNLWRMIWKHPITKIAAAAVIIIAVGFFAVHQGPDEQIETAGILETSKSPVEMMTVLSLNIAYRKGGIEAVEKQCEHVFKPIGRWPRSLSVEQILADFNGNGKSPERTRL